MKRVKKMPRRLRARELGIKIGEMETGRFNAITDVEGVGVGHSTIIRGEGPLVVGEGPIRTVVTAIVPHRGNLYEEKVTAAVHVYNAYGKSVGLEQVRHLGTIETPILSTDTLNVWMVANALIDYMHEAMGVRAPSINPIVGETNGGFLNDSYGRHVRKQHVFEALEKALGPNGSGPVEEGNVGGGTPMSGYGFKGGIGTASRVADFFTLGVLVQLNLGRREDLMIDGAPVGKELSDIKATSTPGSNSIMVYVATDLDLTSRQLWRVARRAVLGLARTGSYGGCTSGDYVIAFSTGRKSVEGPRLDECQCLNPVFRATVEATEEAVVNALFKAETMVGRDGNTRIGIPLERVREVMEKYGRL
ncbi:MAG: Peptidase family S58 [Candidatus Bathyarchaeota archaeon BA1]|nr:MAG: Peptidase family S58 [Candidatus Bathyarchaeota archaeon BA1]